MFKTTEGRATAFSGGIGAIIVNFILQACSIARTECAVITLTPHED
jgi:hypothetical protein